MKVYGIRHHGPGCARSLVTALGEQQPDLILVEAPMEFDQLIPDAASAGMNPPVAALIYQKDKPQNASFYPFAKFSPEWQAIQWAHNNNCAVRSMDLPTSHYLALDQADTQKALAEIDQANDENKEQPVPAVKQSPLKDPFEYFAKADGYTDGERWWNDKMEERENSATFFEAILEAVTALRNELGIEETERTVQREAWMRRLIRKSIKEGYENIAVVCGAWHAPVLAAMPKVSADNSVLKGMPKVKVESTWTPWTYERLSTSSGYGAGIRSPGWYDHLWSRQKHPFSAWLTKAARVLRQQDYEGSPASIIEATRLAESLAGLRGRPRPGLDESLEAIQTVFCKGDSAPLALLNKPLLIGSKFGEVPDGIAKLPLHQDIEATQKRLRLKRTDEIRDLVVDLREESGRRKSVFLHRLQILAIRYATRTQTRSQGTFKEGWQLQWKPEAVLDIVDASRHGNTLLTAAGTALVASSTDATIGEVTERLDLALLGDLPDVARILVEQLDQSAASSGDVTELLRAVPTLVQIIRYGDVRKTDASTLAAVLDHLITRVHTGLPAATVGIDRQSGGLLTGLIRDYSIALNTLQNKETIDSFHSCLLLITDNKTSGAEASGCATRLLKDADVLQSEKLIKLFSYSVSAGNEPELVALWLEGFLSGSGSVLVHDVSLLVLIDNWLKQLPDDAFVNVLPMLRRIFSEFSVPERGQIGMAVQSDNLTSAAGVTTQDQPDLDIDRALPVLKKAARILGLPEPAIRNE